MARPAVICAGSNAALTAHCHQPATTDKTAMLTVQSKLAIGRQTQPSRPDLSSSKKFPSAMRAAKPQTEFLSMECAARHPSHPQRFRPEMRARSATTRSATARRRQRRLMHCEPGCVQRCYAFFLLLSRLTSGLAEPQVRSQLVAWCAQHARDISHHSFQVFSPLARESSARENQATPARYCSLSVSMSPSKRTWSGHPASSGCDDQSGEPRSDVAHRMSTMLSRSCGIACAKRGMHLSRAWIRQRALLSEAAPSDAACPLQGLPAHARRHDQLVGPTTLHRASKTQIGAKRLVGIYTELELQLRAGLWMLVSSVPTSPESKRSAAASHSHGCQSTERLCC
mmetsp:Transcript_125395/g.217182  ORF Transcript_125395/g.217182 Transcript_125395/m.217182 type:complete len:341 (+) Transcript_125395:871-1893(+)